MHIWARHIWSSGVSLKRSCKMRFRRVGFRSTQWKVIEGQCGRLENPMGSMGWFDGSSDECRDTYTLMLCKWPRSLAGANESTEGWIQQVLVDLEINWQSHTPALCAACGILWYYILSVVTWMNKQRAVSQWWQVRERGRGLKKENWNFKVVLGPPRTLHTNVGFPCAMHSVILQKGGRYAHVTFW